MNSTHNSDKKHSVGNDEQNGVGENKCTSNSAEIVAELIRDVENSEKPFNVADLAYVSESSKRSRKEKKEHKKDKKKKKKKRKHESRGRSRSREDRKRSKKSKKHKERSKSPLDSKRKSHKIQKPSEPLKPKVIEEDDEDFTLRGDVKAVKETKLVINIKTVLNKDSNVNNQGSPVDVKKDSQFSVSDSLSSSSPQYSKSQDNMSKEDSEEYGPFTSSRSAFTENESQNNPVNDTRASKIAEKTVARITKKEENKRQLRKKSRNDSSEDERDRRSKKLRRERSHSKEKSSYRSRRDSRSRSRSRERRRRSRSRSYERRRIRKRYSRSRSRSRSIPRNENKIDKAKLLEIAQSRAQKIKTMGMLDPRSGPPQSINDFVSYCAKIQKSQEKEENIEKGENQNSNSDNETEGFQSRIKQSEPIKIKISNGNSALVLPSNDRSANINLMFPVSSGIVHKEHLDLQWQRVEPMNTPLTCSTDQKKYLAITSLEADRKKLTVQQKMPSLPLLPPPPLPPSSLLPPPPAPPVFKDLCPPPPPMPSLLVLPSENDLIKMESSTSSDKIAQVVAQRLVAQNALYLNPNNNDARTALLKAEKQMASWSNVPGKFTGSTGVTVLTPEELQPSDSRYVAWTKKEFDVAASNTSTGLMSL